MWLVLLQGYSGFARCQSQRKLISHELLDCDSLKYVFHNVVLRKCSSKSTEATGFWEPALLAVEEEIEYVDDLVPVKQHVATKENGVNTSILSFPSIVAPQDTK